jgi:hypothetical protein
MLQPVVGAGPGLAGFFWFHSGTVYHHLIEIVVADVAPSTGDVVFGVGVGAGFCAGSCFRLGLAFGFGFGIRTDLSSLPGCSCWRSSCLSGPP